MRLFVAVDPGERLRADLSTGIDEPRRALRARWVDPRRLHITLMFLGERPESDLPALREALLDAVAPHGAFTVVPGDPGCFPDGRRPRVLFLHMESGGALEQLAAAVRKAVAGRFPAEGFDDKPFRPHLTLARFRTPPPATDLETAIAALPRDLDPFQIRAARLVRSRLTPDGPLYDDLAVFTLAPSR